MMCGLRWVVGVVNVARLFGTAHIFSAAHFIHPSLILTSLVLSPALILGTALVIGPALVLSPALVLKPSRLGRISAIGLPRRCGWSPMAKIVHPRTILIGSRLLGFAFVFPLPHSLWGGRWRPMIMLPMHGSLRRHGMLWWQRRRRIGAEWPGLIGVGRVWRLMLRVRRLRRRHAIIVHGWPAVISWAVGPVHHCIWGHWAVLTGAGREGGSRWTGAAIVGVWHPLARL